MFSPEQQAIIIRGGGKSRICKKTTNTYQCKADIAIFTLFNMIENRLALLEKWENRFAAMLDKKSPEYRGALFQCHNERFFLTQLKNQLKVTE